MKFRGNRFREPRKSTQMMKIVPDTIPKCSRTEIVGTKPFMGIIWNLIGIPILFRISNEIGSESTLVTSWTLEVVDIIILTYFLSFLDPDTPRFDQNEFNWKSGFPI